MLTARPAGSSDFPRRSWAISTDGVSVGEVALTGWGVGTIYLNNDTYSAASIQPISHSLPREYRLLKDEDVIHNAHEMRNILYSIDDEKFVFRCRMSPFPWKFFGRSWPGFSLYSPDARTVIGSIFQARALRDDITIDIPSITDESLQLFLLWLVVDRAQWHTHFDNAG